MRRVMTLISIAILTIADQLLKLLVIAKLKPSSSLSFINGVLQWNYVENTGAAFGSFSSHTMILSILTLVIIIAILIYLMKPDRKVSVEYISLVMIISGGLGNLIDRFYRGFVVDYIDPLFIKFAVFNFADMLVTCGAFLLIFWLIKGIISDYIKKGKSDEQTDN